MTETGLWVPVRSNAYSLVAGAPVAAVRRRLKAASITFDRVFLDSTQLHIQAGPGGSVAFPLPDETPGFQAPARRRVGPDQRFFLSVGDPMKGADEIPRNLRRVIDSETVINWAATLRPFASELGSKCDWIEFGTFTERPAVKETARQWTFTDSRNGALSDVIPDRLVRGLVIGNSNADLATAVHAHAAVLQDSLHRQVMARRFADSEGWNAIGFALPIVLPSVGDLGWEDVAAIRNHRSMKDFRRVMQEIEAQALETAHAGGDLEAAVEQAFRQYLSRAAGKVEGLGSVAKGAVYELGFGTMTGVLAAGWSGPLGLVAGVGAGVAKAAIERGVTNMRARRSRGWVSVYQQLDPE